MIIRSEALGKIRGFVDPRDVRANGERLTARLVPNDSVVVANRALQAGATNAMHGDDVDLLALGRALVDAKAADEARRLALAAVKTAAELSRVAGYGSDQVAPALTFLHDRLQELVEEVRDLDKQLGRVRSADGAIIAGATEPWKRIQEAVAVYDEIRQTQFEVTLRIYRSPDRELSTAFYRTGYLADALDHEPTWVEFRDESARYSSTRVLSGADEAYRAWLGDVEVPLRWRKSQTGPWADGDRTAYLRYLATETRPWVPTIEQLEDADAAASSATAPVGGTRHISGWQEARARYYRVTGDPRAEEFAAAVSHPNARARRVAEQLARG